MTAVQATSAHTSSWQRGDSERQRMGRGRQGGEGSDCARLFVRPAGGGPAGRAPPAAVAQHGHGARCATTVRAAPLRRPHNEHKATDGVRQFDAGRQVHPHHACMGGAGARKLHTQAARGAGHGAWGPAGGEVASRGGVASRHLPQPTASPKKVYMTKTRNRVSVKNQNLKASAMKPMLGRGKRRVRGLQYLTHAQRPARARAGDPIPPRPRPSGLTTVPVLHPPKVRDDCKHQSFDC